MRWLTEGLPGTGGRLKSVPEDFRVEEIPAWEPADEGPFLLLRVEKRGMTTNEAARQVARALRLPEREIGFAGIKDARAVASQWFSVPAAAGARLRELDHPHLAIREARRHTHRLQPGDLAGNRFDIVLRGVGHDAAARAEAIVAQLVRRGVQNGFGAQRFGTKGDSDKIGRALARGDCEEALQWYLGRPSPLENDPRIRAARRAFEEGRLDDAHAALPARLAHEAAVLDDFRRHGDARRALARIPKRMRLFFLSAWQARLFNRCLEARLDALDRVLDGDVVVRHETGKAYPARAPALEQPRADAFEISPAGPLFGPGLLLARGAAAAIEEAVFAAAGVAPDHGTQPFRDVHLRGERRAYRFPLAGARVDAVPDGLRLRFELPRGCYATNVVGEITKAEPDAAGRDDGE